MGQEKQKDATRDPGRLPLWIMAIAGIVSALPVVWHFLQWLVEVGKK